MIQTCSGVYLLGVDLSPAIVTHTVMQRLSRLGCHAFCDIDFDNSWQSAVNAESHNEHRCTPDELRAKKVCVVQDRDTALQQGCQGVHQNALTYIC